MGHKFADIAFTDSVKAMQSQAGSRKAYLGMEGDEDYNDVLGPNEAHFIAARDSFYMATVSETGWPYVQHRGGPVGFVKILGPKILGFSDFRGNRQYVSLGNLVRDDRVSLFFMDYPNKTRLKVLGRIKVADETDADLLGKLAIDSTYRGHTERGFVITIEGFDWNCPQHITPRFTAGDVDEIVTPMKDRIAELEAQLARQT